MNIKQTILMLAMGLSPVFGADSTQEELTKNKPDSTEECNTVKDVEEVYPQLKVIMDRVAKLEDTLSSSLRIRVQSDHLDSLINNRGVFTTELKNSILGLISPIRKKLMKKFEELDAILEQYEILIEKGSQPAKEDEKIKKIKEYFDTWFPTELRDIEYFLEDSIMQKSHDRSVLNKIVEFQKEHRKIILTTNRVLFDTIRENK